MTRRTLVRGSALVVASTLVWHASSFAFNAAAARLLGVEHFGSLAALMALLAIVRLAVRYRKPGAAKDRFVTDTAILRAVRRQLRAVQRGREDGGWTPDLAARALTALRVAATYALGRRVTQSRPNGTDARATAVPLDGQVLVASRLARGKRIAVSGSVTSQSIARERMRGDMPPSRVAMLESLEHALSRFTAAQYGRENGKEDTALDASLTDGFRIVRRLQMETLSPLKRFGRRRAAPEVESRAWSR
jgi:hypothetical protein